MIRTAGLSPKSFTVAALAAAALAAGILTGTSDLALAGMALAAGTALAAGLRRARRARAAECQLDVLRDTLGFRKVAENDGVQWVLRVLPDRLTVPGYAVMAVLLQNAYDRPRVVQVRLRHCPVPREGSSYFRVALKAGEVGLLRIPVFLPRELPPESALFSVDVSATLPEGPGVRLLPPSRSRARAARQATLLILGSHGARPLNVWVYEWGGFQPLYITRQTNPDLDPLRVLEELQTAPPA